MEQKKTTKAQLEKRINNALLFIDKGNDYKGIYFADRGFYIHICKDFVVVNTNFHQHVYTRNTMCMFDNPCIYLETLVDIANEHLDEISFTNEKNEVCYSLDKLIALDSLEDSERTIAKLVERFIYVINDGVYAIGNKPQEVNNLMTQYLCMLAKVKVYGDIHDEDLNRNDYYNEFISWLRYTSLDGNLDDKKLKELEKVVYDAEKEAYDKIKAFVKNNGGEMFDTVALPKNDADESEALKELQN